jgi:predicted nucleotide-binding protein
MEDVFASSNALKKQAEIIKMDKPKASIQYNFHCSFFDSIYCCLTAKYAKVSQRRRKEKIAINVINKKSQLLDWDFL